MRSDSAETKRQKTQLKESVSVAYDIQLPEWFVEGTLVGDFRILRKLLEMAHARYMSQGSIPVKEPK